MEIKLSEQQANDLKKAISFFMIGCTEAPDHKTIDYETLAIFQITPERVFDVAGISDQIDKKLKRAAKKIK